MFINLTDRKLKSYTSNLCIVCGKSCDKSYKVALSGWRWDTRNHTFKEQYVSRCQKCYNASIRIDSNWHTIRLQWLEFHKSHIVYQ